MSDAPSVILTRAADLIRDTAAATAPGRWAFARNHARNGQHVQSTLVLPPLPGSNVARSRGIRVEDTPDYEWIALMSPAVAGLVAEMLRAAVGMWRLYEGRGWPPEKVEAHVDGQARAALALARHVIAVLDGKDNTDG